MHCQLKFLAQLKSGDAIDSAEIHPAGEYPVFGGNGIRGYAAKNTHDTIAPLIGRQGALCGNVNFATGQFYATEHAIVAEPRKGVHARWLFWALKSLELNQYSMAAAQPGLAVDAIERVRCTTYSTDEQERIANFLDEQTARIDALIAEKERLLEVLSESLDSAIERTVLPIDRATHGVALKRVAHRVMTGPFGSALHSSEYVEGGVPVINPSHILGSTLVPALDVTVPQAIADALASYKLSEGELIVGRRGEMGRCAVVPPEGEGWLCGTGCLLVTPDPQRVLPQYLQLVVSSRAARDWLSLESVGSTMENLNAEILGRLPGYFPSMDEQERRIAEAVNARDAHANLFSHVEAHISRLREYRASLISAAVTGQLDINSYKEAA